MMRMTTNKPFPSRIALSMLLALASLGVATSTTAFAQQPFWSPTGGPLGGSILTLAGAPDSSFYFSTAVGLFHSSGSLTPDEALTSNAVSPLMVLAGGVLLGGNGRSLIRSSDGGRTWSIVAVGAGYYDRWQSLRAASGKDIYVLKISRTDFGDAWNELWRSTNEGLSWQQVETAPVIPFAVAVEDDGAILVSGVTGLHRSTDRGATWVQLHELGGGILVAKGDTLLISVTGPWNGSAYHVLRSSDAGITWTDAGELGRPGAAEYSGAGILYHIVNTSTVLRSSDWGSTWTVDSNLVFDVSTLFRDARGTLWAGTVLEGLFRLDDESGRWIESNRGFARTSIRALWVTSKGTIAADMGGRIVTSFDTGRTWRKWFAPLGALSVEQTQRGTFVLGTSGATLRSVDSGRSVSRHGTKGFHSLLTLPSGRIIGGSYSEGIASSVDDGETWTVDHRVLRPDSAIQFRPIEMSASGIIYVGTGSGYLLYSIDSGTTWRQSSPSLPNGRVINAIATGDSGVVYVCSANGTLFRSNDTARTWQRIDQRFGGSVNDVVRTPNGHLFATTTERGIFRSVDRGDRWAPAGLGLPPDAAYQLVALSNGEVLLGTDSWGLWKCRSDRRSAGLEVTPRIIIFDTTIAGSVAFDTTIGVYNAGDDTLRDVTILVSEGTSVIGDLAMLAPGDTASLHVTFAPRDSVTFTTGLTIRSSAISSPDFIRFDGVVQSVSAKAPKEFDRMRHRARLQPNPVHDVLTIYYDLAISGNVRISLVDVLGTERVVIHDETASAGHMSVRWSRREASLHLPPGFYLCRVEEPEGCTTRPLLID